MNLDACIERKEPRLSDRRDLRSILHLGKNKPRALTVAIGKIDGLRLQVCQNGLDGRACILCATGLARSRCQAKTVYAATSTVA